MSGTLVVLDIGSTLVEGPAQGPGSRLAAVLDLAAPEKRQLTHAIMTTWLPDAEAAYEVVRTRFGRSGDAVRRAVAEIWAAQETDARPIPGAAEALGRMVAHGYRLALLSNIWTPYLRSVQKHFGVFFEAHIPPELQLFSCREGLAKPAPELFAAVLRRARVDAADAVMVGDSYKNDVAPASAIGMRTVWLLHDAGREASALVGVLNGALPGPTSALRSLADLDADGPWSARAEPATAHYGASQAGRSGEGTCAS